MISESGSRKKKCTISFLIVTAGIILSCITAFFGYDILPDYQDKLIHLRRIAALADTLKSGYFPARIYFVMNGGTGYAMPVFYPDVNLYLPAFLHILGMPLGICYAVYVIITNIVTALISYFCIKGFLKCFRSSEGSSDAGCCCGSFGCIPAATGSFLYTLSVYRLTNVYIRDAVGEYTAMAILPLVIYGFARIYTYDASGKRGRFDEMKCALPLGAGMTLLAYSHVLTTMVASALLAISALVFFKKTFTGKVLGRLALSVLMFLCMSASVLVPMLDYMRSDTYLVDGSSYIMRGFYPGWRELLELIPSGSGSGIAYDLRMPTAIGAALTAVLAAYGVTAALRFIVSLRDKKLSGILSGTSFVRLYLFVLAGIILFVSSKYFPWTYIESKHNALSALFCSIQFSWRYIGIATVITVFLGSMLIRDMMMKNRRMGICIAVLLSVLAVVPALVLECRACSENPRVRIGEGSEIGIVGDELYYPVSWNRDAVYDGMPQAFGGAVTESFEKTDYRWNVRITAGSGEGSVASPVVYYKGYKSVSDGQILETYQGEDGRVVTKIPEGFDGTVEMKFSEPIFWRASEIITLLSVILVCTAMHMNRKRSCAGKDNVTEVAS